MTMPARPGDASAARREWVSRLCVVNALRRSQRGAAAHVCTLLVRKVMCASHASGGQRGSRSQLRTLDALQRRHTRIQVSGTVPDRVVVAPAATRRLPTACTAGDGAGTR